MHSHIHIHIDSDTNREKGAIADLIIARHQHNYGVGGTQKAYGMNMVWDMAICVCVGLRFFVCLFDFVTYIYFYSILSSPRFFSFDSIPLLDSTQCYFYRHIYYIVPHLFSRRERGEFTHVHPLVECREHAGLIWYATFGRIHLHLFYDTEPDDAKRRDFELCLTSGLPDRVYVWWDSKNDSWSAISPPVWHGLYMKSYHDKFRSYYTRIDVKSLGKITDIVMIICEISIATNNQNHVQIITVTTGRQVRQLDAHWMF